MKRASNRLAGDLSRPGAPPAKRARRRAARPPSAAPAALLVIALLAFSAFMLPTHALEERTWTSPELRDRYETLVGELRCLVCQNQNIASSDAELARDMRDKVDEMLRAGSADEEIVEHMVARYGDFVRYRPPVNAATALLWGGPFALAVLALVWLLMRIRRRPPAAPPELTADERARLAALRVGTDDDDAGKAAS